MDEVFEELVSEVFEFLTRRLCLLSVEGAFYSLAEAVEVAQVCAVQGEPRGRHVRAASRVDDGTAGKTGVEDDEVECI